jgi:hypothetical protein
MHFNGLGWVGLGWVGLGWLGCILMRVTGLLRQYLSTFISGIGPALAKRIVATFDNRVFDVLQNSPEELLLVSGVCSNVNVCTQPMAWKLALRHTC